MKFRRVGTLLSVLVLAACSATAGKLEQSSSTKVETRGYSENYQEIYRRVFTAANACAGGSLNAYASMSVDGQLYSELGFGEVTLSMSNLGMKNFYWKAKVEQAGKGSSMTVHSGNTINNSMWLNNVIRWASGDAKC
ncbi:hypothetical protein [Devosia sp. 2618]|uniref:hypothetical protein n=1 Tax=Devosia sp. 2618 TaxID=3156454 RepID=UPI00339565CF